MYLSLSRRREILPDGSIIILDSSRKPVKMLALYPDRKEAQEKILNDLLGFISRLQVGTEEDLGI